MRDQDQKGADQDALLDICDRLQDEGDRVYLGSTNDAERLREIAKGVWLGMLSAPTNTGLGDLDLDEFLDDVGFAYYSARSNEAWNEVRQGFRDRILAARSPQPAAPEGGMREALEPFYQWAKDNVAAEDGGGYIWDGLGCQKERINVWFGPSEFGRLAEVYAALSTDSRRGGEGSSVAERAAAGASRCAASDVQCQSEDDGRPIGWRVKDYADGWISFDNVEDALREVAAMGEALLQAVFVQPEGGAR